MSAVTNLPALGAARPAFLTPNSFETVTHLAERLCAARWLPKSYLDRNGNPNQAMVEVAIMHGLEVGLPPMAAVQNIAVINGMPSVWGDAMIALVRNSGLLEDLVETYEGEGEKLTAMCSAKRKGQASLIVKRFSVAMAKQAGLWSKQGPWTQYPARMLQLRARAFCLRDGFSDVLKGLAMAEEVQDMIDVTPEPAPSRPQRNAYVQPKPSAHQPAETIEGTYTEPTEEDERAAEIAAQRFAETGEMPTDEHDEDGVVTEPCVRDPFWAGVSLEIEPPVTSTGKPLWVEWEKLVRELLAEARTHDEAAALESHNGKHLDAYTKSYSGAGAALRSAIRARADELGREAA